MVTWVFLSATFGFSFSSVCKKAKTKAQKAKENANGIQQRWQWGEDVCVVHEWHVCVCVPVFMTVCVKPWHLKIKQAPELLLSWHWWPAYTDPWAEIRCSCIRLKFLKIILRIVLIQNRRKTKQIKAISGIKPRQKMQREAADLGTARLGFAEDHGFVLDLGQTRACSVSLWLRAKGPVTGRVALQTQV